MCLAITHIDLVSRAKDTQLKVTRYIWCEEQTPNLYGLLDNGLPHWKKKKKFWNFPSCSPNSYPDILASHFFCHWLYNCCKATWWYLVWVQGWNKKYVIIYRITWPLQWKTYCNKNLDKFIRAAFHQNRHITRRSGLARLFTLVSQEPL